MKDIVVKTDWIDDNGVPQKKYHNAGILFIDDKGGMFGSLKIFGHDIRFSVYDKKEKSKPNFTKPDEKELNNEPPF